MISASQILDQKVSALGSLSGVSRPLLDRFVSILCALDDRGLYRMNPVDFASRHGFDERETIDLFIHGTKAGLFDVTWSRVCPFCGGREHSFSSVNQIGMKSHCTVCDVDIPEELDAQMEVSFTITAAVHHLELHELDDFDSYRQTFFSPNFIPSDGLAAYSREMFRGFQSAPARTTIEVPLEGKAGELYRLINVVLHSAVHVHFTEEQPASIGTIQVLDSGFVPTVYMVRPGAAVLRVQNERQQKISFSVIKTDFPRLHKILEEQKSTFQKFLTGKMILNNQVFRDHFRIQDLLPDLRLKISSLTILFTDLKGSTELYDRAGDVSAYSVIQKHFEILTRAAKAHSGAIIKTMGDAIMAAFSTPSAGVAAALEMLSGMENLNADPGNKHPLGLKIGLHEGSALVVNADDRLDYFGQTVNIAARVQGLAGAGEILMTPSVFNGEGVQALLARQGRKKALKRDVSLKGVGGSTTVIKLPATA